MLETSEVEAGATMLTWLAPEFTSEKIAAAGAGGFFTVRFLDDQTIVMAGTSGTIQVRDARTGRPRYEFGQHPSTVRNLAISPDGRTVATVTVDDLIVRLWDLRGWTLVASLRGHTGSVNEVVFAPKGNLLASAGTGTDVAVWFTDPKDAVERVCANLADAGERGLASIGCP